MFPSCSCLLSAIHNLCTNHWDPWQPPSSRTLQEPGKFLHIPLQHAQSIRSCSCPPLVLAFSSNTPKGSKPKQDRQIRCSGRNLTQQYSLSPAVRWSRLGHRAGTWQWCSTGMSHAETGPAGRHIVAAADCQGLSPDVQRSMASAHPQITQLGMLRHVRKDANRSAYWGQREPIAKSQPGCQWLNRADSPFVGYLHPVTS